MKNKKHKRCAIIKHCYKCGHDRFINNHCARCKSPETMIIHKKNIYGKMIDKVVLK